MPEYRIFETKQYLSDLEYIDASLRGRLYKKIAGYIYPQLKQNPHYGPNIKKLIDFNPQTWRYRIGNYRLFYEIDGNNSIVFITSLEHRKNAY